MLQKLHLLALRFFTFHLLKQWYPKTFRREQPLLRIVHLSRTHNTIQKLVFALRRPHRRCSKRSLNHDDRNLNEVLCLCSAYLRLLSYLWKNLLQQRLMYSLRIIIHLSHFHQLSSCYIGHSHSVRLKTGKKRRLKPRFLPIVARTALHHPYRYYNKLNY